MVNMCQNLQSLQLFLGHGLLKETQHAIHDQICAILTPTFNIVQLQLKTIYIDWGAIARLKTLKDLRISDCDTYIYSVASDFWGQESVPSLESLCLINVMITEFPSQDHDQEHTTFNIPLFPNIKSLEIELMAKIPERIQLELIKNCPSMETFRFRAFSRQHPHSTISKDIVQLAVNGAWPKLRDFHYDGPNMSEQNVTDLLKSFRMLLQWDVPYIDFNPDCFQALTCHFPTITRVNFVNCKRATSRMLLTILSSCPQLTKFRGHTLLPKDIIQSKRWICTSLMTFSVYIDFDSIKDEDDESMDLGLSSAPNTMGDIPQEEEGEEGCKAIDHSVSGYRKLIFERIGQLYNLRILMIGVDPEASYLNDKRLFTNSTVRFKLGEGLENLIGLKKLEILGTIKNFDIMTVEDVEWMKTHWKRLTEVMGPFGHEYILEKEYEKLLKNRRSVNGLN
ncbi:hypothetical protein BGZ76_002881 [Entomortierella beljakovae]|nr:hypothetical protein BGZ76_002881 [Entomortierella beljakovae]